MTGLDKNEFFRQVTLRICGSLEIEIALERCFEYLEKLMPVDGLYINICEKDFSAVRSIARASAAGRDKKEIRIPLPKKMVGKYMDERGPALLKAVVTIEEPGDNPISEAEAPILGYGGKSLMVLRLIIEGAALGVLLASCRPGSKFQSEHEALFALLREPMAIALANTLEHREVVSLKGELKEDNRFLKQEIKSLACTVLIGEEGGLLEVMEAVRQTAPLSNTVLILGETGTGKEVVANAIHRSSPRKSGPFIKVNCGAIPESLIDSELFGHEKGAFTGAVGRNLGRFERAHGGTIFLDEIGELPPQAQVRLLRVLQSKEIERVGGSGPFPVDIRVIAATHRDLESMVAENRFREDLYFRLNAFPINIPPLRRRREDIPELLRHAIERKGRALGFRAPPPLADGALEQLTAYRWPGNVRELENVVERALIQNKGRSLALDHFNFAQQPNGPMEALGERCGCVFPCLALPAEERREVAEKNAPLGLEELHHRHITEMLEFTGGKIHGQGGAAELLGVNPSTLRNKMNKLKIVYGRAANR